MHSKKEIVVFDFDGTLYAKDSLIMFCRFVYQHKPRQLIYFPIQVIGLVLYTLRLIDTQKFKNIFLLYLKNIPEEEVRQLADTFWANAYPKHFNATVIERLQEHQNKGDLVICITASPVIYLQPIYALLSLSLIIGTELELKNKQYTIRGKNCKGKEKINRLIEFFPENVRITSAYSDSYADAPLFELAERAYFVKQNRIFLLH